MSNQSDLNLYSLADTPLKKLALVTFILTNIGMFVVPAGLGALGSALDWPAAETVSVVGIGFVINEVILFGSIAILGKPLVSLIRSKLKYLFRSKSRHQ
jgi:hypothetical protein